MVKDALRVTRKLSRLRGRCRSPRPKTFKTEEKAKEWAKANGVEKFTLTTLQKEKIRVDAK